MQVKSLGANKTQITYADGRQIFVSYSTPVAAFVPGEGYYRTNVKYSRTTSRHITQWLEGVKAQEKPQSFFEQDIHNGVIS